FNFGGTVTSLAVTFGAGGWVETTEQNLGYASPGVRGVSDTLVLLLNGMATGVVARDDDSGVIQMSKLRLTAACPTCQIVVGEYAASGAATMKTTGVATLSYSDDTADTDHDGLPDSFEAKVGTLANDPDS